MYSTLELAHMLVTDPTANMSMEPSQILDLSHESYIATRVHRGLLQNMLGWEVGATPTRHHMRGTQPVAGVCSA